MQGSPAIDDVPANEEQRFRASLISSTAIHVAVILTAWLAPQLWPRPVVMPDVTPIRVVQLPQARTPAPAEEEPPPQEPEPLPTVTTEAEPIPRSIDDLREQQLEEERLREEELQRQRQEAERRRREEEERRRREEEERRRREEEEQRARPQRATRSGTEAPARSQSARRSEIAFTGTEADQRSFTVEDFPFAWYVARIKDLVARHWDPPSRGAHALRLEADVFFRIGRDGRVVVGPELLSGSGQRVFDQAALRAIAAADLPPLPREYEGRTLGVRFAFIEE